MIDVIKISNIDGFLEKKLIKSSTQKTILKEYCIKDCQENYNHIPRRTRYGFFYYDEEYDITVYYIIRYRNKGKTVL